MAINRADKLGFSDIKELFEDDLEERPDPNVRPYSEVLIPFAWAFYYLKEGSEFEDALKNILSHGGDTKANAAVVAGMVGAA